MLLRDMLMNLFRDSRVGDDFQWFLSIVSDSGIITARNHHKHNACVTCLLSELDVIKTLA